MKLKVLAAFNIERAARRPAALVTDLNDGTIRLITLADLLPASDPLMGAVAEAIRSGRSAGFEIDGRRWFITVAVPPVRILIVGAVHISQALAPMARLAGFDVSIVDPRTAFATPERFPDVELLAEWPDAVLERRPLDAFTAVAALTHDPKIDDVALTAALGADCFYIGALGSRKTHARREERLEQAGFTRDQIARIRAPIGIDIGASTPAEIAVSILGEIIGALRQKRRALLSTAA